MSSDSGSGRTSLVPQLLGSLVVVLILSVTLPAIATALFALSRHPECAEIPDSVGPCDYWGRVAEYGPFIMLVGTVITLGLGLVAWLIVAAVVGLLALGRRDPESEV